MLTVLYNLCRYLMDNHRNLLNTQDLFFDSLVNQFFLKIRLVVYCRRLNALNFVSLAYEKNNIVPFSFISISLYNFS